VAVVADVLHAPRRKTKEKISSKMGDFHFIQAP
jgi:hypothetical protein